MSMHIVSWNVNGIRAALGKGLDDFWRQPQHSVLCLQETKVDLESWQKLKLEVPFGYEYWYPAERKGYSGTALLSKVEPLAVEYGIGGETGEHPLEGRVITAEFDGFYLVNVYVPNSGRGLVRLDYRQNAWDPDFRSYVAQLQQHKPIVICGDLNVAHTEIDLANPASNRMNAGFTPQERAGFDRLLNTGLMDTFRYFHPDEKGHYTWWTYRSNARERNIGWRLDYFLASESLQESVVASVINSSQYGSDHCPITLEVKADLFA